MPLKEFDLGEYVPYLLNVTGTKVAVLSAALYRTRFGIRVPNLLRELMRDLQDALANGVIAGALAMHRTAPSPKKKKRVMS